MRIAPLCLVLLVAHAASAQAPSAPPLVSDSAPAPAPSPPVRVHRTCVWPAVGGATVGLATAWYGLVGVMALTGRDAFALQATPGTVAGLLGLEVAGMVGGTIGACALWGDEGRWWPTASSVIIGAVIGGAALSVGAQLLVQQTNPRAGGDFPIGTVLTIMSLTLAGVVLGGYAGYRMDLAWRGPPGGAPAVALVPLVLPGGGGVVLGGRW